jgi:hypothetical protein
MSNKIIPKYIPITPKALYLKVINGSFDQIRQEANGYTYVAPQFGGIFGQTTILQKGLVMEVTEFEVK